MVHSSTLMAESDRLLEDSCPEIKSSSKRWLIALIVGIQILSVRYNMNSVGIVNDVYVEYFNISYPAVDWFTVIQFPGGVFGNLVVALLIFYGNVGLRKLSVSLSLLSMFTSIAMLLASVWTFLYPLIYIGEFLMGVSYSTAKTMIVEMANSWFPKNEVGKALIVLVISSATASILAFEVASNILKQPGFSKQNLSHAEELSDHQIWHSETRQTLLLHYGTYTVVVVVVFALVLKFLEDKPLKPPSYAQLQLRSDYNNTQATSNALNFSSFLRKCKLIVFNEVFFLISMVAIVTYTINAVFITFFSEILRPINRKSHFMVASNVLSGYILVTYDMAIVLGGFASSYIFDRYKKHVLQLALAYVFMLLLLVGLLFGLHNQVVSIVWVFSALFGVAYGFLVAPLYDLPVQHLHPIKPGIISALLVLVQSAGSTIVTQSFRYVLNYGGGAGVVIFLMILAILVLIICFFLKAKFQPLHINS